jgi:hypothetical protein
MKHTKLALAMLFGLSVSSAAFATASEGSVSNTKEAASDIALSQKHFKAVNGTDPKKRKVLFEEVYDLNVHFASPRGIADGRAETHTDHETLAHRLDTLQSVRSPVARQTRARPQSSGRDQRRSLQVFCGLCPPYIT